MPTPDVSPKRSINPSMISSEDLTKDLNKNYLPRGSESLMKNRKISAFWDRKKNNG